MIKTVLSIAIAATHAGRGAKGYSFAGMDFASQESITRQEKAAAYRNMRNMVIRGRQIGKTTMMHEAIYGG
jgi:hypothetical protein